MPMKDKKKENRNRLRLRHSQGATAVVSQRKILVESNLQQRLQETAPEIQDNHAVTVTASKNDDLEVPGMARMPSDDEIVIKASDDDHLHLLSPQDDGFRGDVGDMLAAVAGDVQPPEEQHKLDISERTQRATEQALTEDIYSLLSTVKVFSVGYLFAFGIFLIQLMILILVFIDLIDVTDNPIKTNGVDNRLNVPADAGMTVLIAQFLGVILIVNFMVAEGDMIRGITHLLDGYDPYLLSEYPHATHAKWIAAGMFQTIVGVVMIIDMFILMIQSAAVIDMCLNFAALDFVQYFDDAAFALGTMGFISKDIQTECLQVGRVHVKTEHRNRNNSIRKGIVIAMTIALYIPYFIIARWKWTGRFMCSKLHVQFGDAYGPEWPYFSGVFDSPGKLYPDRHAGRIIYYDQSHTLKLSYCKSLKVWTFSNMTATDDECDNFMIKSSVTSSYDLMEVAGENWYANTEHMGYVDMDWISVTCADCDEMFCSPSVGHCSDDNQCICDEGYMGLSCEFEVPTCKFLGLDTRSKASLPSLPFASLFLETEYVILEHNSSDQFYGLPMYGSYNFQSGELDVLILFTGRRWIIMGVPQNDQNQESDLDATELLYLFGANDPVNHRLRTLLNVTQTLKSFQPFFFSSPVDYGTPTHKVDPTSVEWVLAKRDENLPLLGYKPNDVRDVSPAFICSHCDDKTNPCLNEGKCNTTTTYCECPESYGGFMCEYSFNCRERGCLNGGTCDEIFNVCKNCDPAYYGNLCQFRRPGVVDYEVAMQGGGDFFLCFNETTCYNGGWCTGNLTKCSCPPDFEGDYCERLRDNSTLFVDGAFICTNSTCINGGYCVGDATECTCPASFSGQLCELVLSNDTIVGTDEFFHCFNGTCLNGGYCASPLEPCVCQKGFDGDFCQSSATLVEGHALCEDEKCQNGGFCKNILEVCQCPEEFVGDFCETPANSTRGMTDFDMAEWDLDP